MKMKSFAMLAMSGLLTASFAYIAPAMAEDTSNVGQAMDAPSDNGMQQNDMNQNNDMTQNNPSGDMSNTNNPGSSNDSGMPDTATGDDDY